MRQVTRLAPSRNDALPERLFDDGAVPMRDADNLGLVTRHTPRVDDVSIDPTLLDDFGNDEPVKWPAMSCGERAAVVLALLLIGLAYWFVVRALR